MAGLLTDRDILHFCFGVNPMIKPFEDMLISSGVISYGLSSVGYGIRLSNQFSELSGIIDPKERQESVSSSRHRATDGRFLLRPNSWVLGASLEYFKMPENLMGLVVGKSTYARCGVHVFLGTLEPGWEGDITLEIANLGNQPVWLYIGEGIAQILFFRTDERPQITYSDRNGKYQGQRGLTYAQIGD